MTAKQYQGVVVPMVTPFTADGEVDIAAAERIIKHIVATGASIFVLGTTGEAPSIAPAAKMRLVEAAVRKNTGRTTTYAGISDTCAAVFVDLAGRLQAHADGIADIYCKGRLLSQSLPVHKAIMSVYDFCGPHVLPPLQVLSVEQIRELKDKIPILEAMIHPS